MCVLLTKNVPINNINIFSVGKKIRHGSNVVGNNEILLCLYVNYPFFVQFYPNSELLDKSLFKPSVSKFTEIRLESATPIYVNKLRDRRTDRHDETNRCFLGLFERT